MDEGRTLAMLSALIRFFQTPVSQITPYRVGPVSGLSIPDGFYVLRGRDGDRAILYLDIPSKRWRLLFLGRHDEYERYLNNQFRYHVKEIQREGGRQ